MLIRYDEAISGERDLLEAFVEYLAAIGCNARLLILGDSQQGFGLAQVHPCLSAFVCVRSGVLPRWCHRAVPGGYESLAMVLLTAPPLLTWV